MSRSLPRFAWTRDPPVGFGTHQTHDCRPHVEGLRLPSVEQVLQDSKTVWQSITVNWYGEGKRTLEMCTGTALWYRYGLTPLPIRWVLTRDPQGKCPPKALFSTDQSQAAEEIIKHF